MGSPRRKGTTRKGGKRTKGGSKARAKGADAQNQRRMDLEMDERKREKALSRRPALVRPMETQDEHPPVPRPTQNSEVDQREDEKRVQNQKESVRLEEIENDLRRQRSALWKENARLKDERALVTRLHESLHKKQREEEGKGGSHGPQGRGKGEQGYHPYSQGKGKGGFVVTKPHYEGGAHSYATQGKGKGKGNSWGEDKGKGWGMTPSICGRGLGPSIGRKEGSGKGGRSGEPRSGHHSIRWHFRRSYITGRYLRRIAVIPAHRIYFLQTAAPCMIRVAFMVLRHSYWLHLKFITPTVCINAHGACGLTSDPGSWRSLGVVKLFLSQVTSATGSLWRNHRSALPA